MLKKLLLALPLVAAGAAASLIFTLDRPMVTEAHPANTMSVDAVSGGTIDSDRTVTTADPFDVDIYIQHGGSSNDDYNAYQVSLCFDSAIVRFVPTDDLDDDGIMESWTYTDLGGMRAHEEVFGRPDSCSGGPGTNLLGGSIRSGRTTTDASGVAVTARFACVGSGSTTVHLVTPSDSSVPSGTHDPAGWALPTNLVDATITCEPPPTPTPCPTGVCTPTPTLSPSPTPTVTTTPDPSAHNEMAVDAVSGGGIDSIRSAPAGSRFDIDIDILSSLDYAGHNTALCFDSSVLGFVPTEDLTGDGVPESWRYTRLGGLLLEAVVAVREPSRDCPASFPDTMVVGGAARSVGATSASGAAITARFACVAEGTTVLHLVSKEEHGFWTRTSGLGGINQPTDLADATIICLPDTDGDGCADDYELALGFDPSDLFDVYSVPAPANADPSRNGPRDNWVEIRDMLAVLSYVFADESGPPNANGVSYDSLKDGDWNNDTQVDANDRAGLRYDRSHSPEPNPPWDAGPPDGAIDIGDVLGVLAQFGLDCSGPP